MPALTPAQDVLLYCHDTYGLGHLRRSLLIAGSLASSARVGGQLIVTGSPVVDRFELPARTDHIKLPAATKVGEGLYESRSLPVPFPTLRALRSDLILAAARRFRPDMVIVDHSPAGLAGEAVPALRYLRRKSPGTRLVLGLRDVLDDADRVRREWDRTGVHELLDDVYDTILVYGQRDLYDPVRRYGFSTRAARKTRFCGYLTRPTVQDEEAAVAPTDRPLVLVSVGGGGDGARLLSAVAESLAARLLTSDVDWLLVGGPFLPVDVRSHVDERIRGLHHVRYVDFVPDLPLAMRRAAAVIAMGGYNTVCEILASGTPALLVPRVQPRLEQWIRAKALARRGHVRMIHPSHLDARRLDRELTRLLSDPPPERAGLALDGLARVRAQLDGAAAWDGAAA
jgi:predicted glycosyltransferase